MEYEDFTQDLYISFEAGMQRPGRAGGHGGLPLPEEQRRHRVSFGDIQRNETVRNLMVTVAKKLVSNIGKLDQFVDILQRNVETSLSGTDLTWFVTKAIGINLDTGVQGNAPCRGWQHHLQRHQLLL